MVTTRSNRQARWRRSGGGATGEDADGYGDSDLVKTGHEMLKNREALPAMGASAL